MEKSLHITTQSLSEILKAIKDVGEGSLSLSFSPDSILANPENKRILKLFAQKHKIELHVGEHGPEAAPLVAPVVASPPMTEAPAGDEEGPTLAEVIAKETHNPVPEFAINKDVATGEDISDDTEEPPIEDSSDVAETTLAAPETSEEGVEPESEEAATEEASTDEPDAAAPLRRGRPLRVPKPTLALLVRNHRVIAAALIGSVVFFAVGVGLLWYAPSAEVTVTVANKPIQRELTIVAAANASTDPSRNQIALNKTEVKETVSGTAKATGKKTVGDKAKGKVTIRNYSVVNDVSLSAGTTLVVLGGDGDGLQFVTATAASVPHGTETSSTDSEGTITISNKPGKVDVEVAAADLGSKYNLPSGTRVAVNNQSTKSIDGVASTDLTGGKSEDKQVVTAADQKALLDQLTTKATAQGNESVNQKIGQGQKLVASSVKTDVTKQTFDKQVDEEATDFKLALESLTSANYYVEDEAKQVLKANLAKLVPDGYKLDESSIEYAISPLSLDSTNVSLQGEVKATLLPNLGTNSVQSTIVDKPVAEVESFFKGKESVVGVDINVQPPYYRSFNRMPPRQQNIKVTFKSQ